MLSNICLTRGHLARFAAALVVSTAALGALAAELPLTLERAWQLA